MNVSETTEEAIRERLRTYSLSELEDVFAHVDRHEFPDRHALVAREIEARLKELGPDAAGTEEESPSDSPGFWRRIGASFVDLSIQALVPYLIFFLIRATFFPPRQAGPPVRGGQNDIWGDVSGIFEAAVSFVSGVFSADSQALKDLVTYAPMVGFYLVYRLAWMGFGWVRTGATPGMRELGIRLVRQDGGKLSIGQAVGRFFLHHILFVFTLGISGLWMLKDVGGRALHDKIMGTRLVRTLRSWEKPLSARRFD